MELNLSENQKEELKTFLLKRCEYLRDIENIDEFPDALEQAIEIKSQKRAYEKLMDIIDEIELDKKPTRNINEYNVL